MESSDPEKRAGLGSAMPSDKSINTLAHATAGSDPEKAHGRDGLGSDHHLGRRHADDEDGDDVEETDDDHDSESTRAGEIQPVQSRSQSIINRVLSTRSIDPGPPPDGGWSAWVTGEFLQSPFFPLLSFFLFLFGRVGGGEHHLVKKDIVLLITIMFPSHLALCAHLIVMNSW